MTMPDWKEAPTEATHYDCNADVFCNVNGFWCSGNYTVMPGQKGWGSDRYTPRPVEPATTAWDGTGRPKVGTACECDWTESGRYEPAVVKFVGSMIIVVECEGAERVVYVEDAARQFRPIQFQAKTEREELIRIATQVLNHDDVLTERDAAEALYDAGMLRLNNSQTDRTQLVKALNQLRGEADMGLVADVILSIGFRLER